MPQITFAAEAYEARSLQLIAQEAVNCFVEPTPPAGKTQSPVYGTPGLNLFSRQGNGPINGMHVMGQTLYIVSDGALYAVTFDQVLQAGIGGTVIPKFLGQASVGGLLSLADNGRQLVFVDGSSGWIYQPGGVNQVTTATQVAGATFVEVNISGTIANGDPIDITLDSGAIFHTTSTVTVGPLDLGIAFADPLPTVLTAGAIIIDPSLTLARIAAPAFMPADTVRYFDGYFVFNAHGTRQWFISAINDGTQYSGLDFATASASSFLTMAVEVYHEQLLIFTEGNIEVWWDAGALAFPFQRYDAALIQRGLSASLAVASEDNTVLWMGEDLSFYRLESFAPKRISTFAMETAWAQYPLKGLDVSAFVLNQEGHKFVVLNFPSGERTWVYDISSGKWARRESFGTRWV